MAGGGFPAEPIQAELRARGVAPLRPPSADASRLGDLADLWKGGGLSEVETRQIAVQRTYSDFDDFWTTTLLSPSTGPVVATLPPAEVESLKARVRARLPADSEGRITYTARATAVRGRVPG
jgi:hypothetical protein